MTKIINRIINVSTNEINDVEFTEEQLEIALSEEKVRADAESAKGTQKAALLDRLGISADEAVLLLS